MLEIGFKEDMEKIFSYIKDQRDQKPQFLFYSATIPYWMDNMSKQYMDKNRVFVDLLKDGFNNTPTNIQHFAINCPFFQRHSAIGDIITYYGKGKESRVIIFTSTKHEANDILLKGEIKQKANVLHGDIPQKQREVTFKQFKEGTIKCLIATNVAARGLDIPEIDLVLQLEPPKEVDTYVHRAGRTARAGNTGICVTFFSPNHAELMKRIERQAKIKFQKVGPPQPEDLLRAAQRDISSSLRSVSENNLALFDETAQQLIEEVGPKEALQRALAYISGYSSNEMKQRSLLCSAEGMVTVQITFEIYFERIGFVWGFLRKNFNEKIIETARGMKRVKNSNAVVFDISEDYKQDIQTWIDENQDAKDKVEFPKEIPELDDEGNGRGQSSGGNGNARGYQQNTFADKGKISQALKNKKDLECFVGGLPFTATDNDLISFFKTKNATALQSRMLTDNNGKSKGVSFVLFDSKNCVSSAMNCNGSQFQGRTLRINMASQGKR